MSDPLPFWKRKSLSAMSRAEWESLCDGCGRCCLHKIRDEDTEEIHFTNVACRMLDTQGCGCRDYANRRDHVPDCVQLKPRMLAALDWLPPTCAYHILARGGDLPDWHPLVSGDPESVHRAGISVRGRAISEREAGALEDHVVTWPGRWPPASRKAGQATRAAAAPVAAPAPVPAPGVAPKAAPAAAGAKPPMKASPKTNVKTGQRKAG